MKTANIHTEAKITLNSNCTIDGEPIHTIEFDGVVADIIGDKPTKREIEIFKIGILYERERLWDESKNLVDDNVMRKLLKHYKKRIYRIDHCYFYDSNKSCLLIESDLEPNDLVKIIVAIHFKFEELVDESLNINFIHLLDILKRFYNVKDVKEKYKNILNETERYIFDEEEFSTNDECDYIYKFNLDEVEVIKIEVVSARDKYCGTNFEDIYKYLVKGSEIENMISDYMKYIEEYEKFIEYKKVRRIREKL
ncbi:MAG: hypothetical protein NSGCLCUN01_02872 [uncultured Clostridium sp.]